MRRCGIGAILFGAAAKKLRSSSPYPLPRLRHIVPVPVRERNRCPLPRRCFTFVETALPAQALWKCLRDFRIHYIAKEKDHETVKKVQRPCHARRPRKTQGKCVLFADAAKLYIEYSKAVTSAETAVKRMRFFAQFYNAAFAERDIASISPCDIASISPYVPPATA